MPLNARGSALVMRPTMAGLEQVARQLPKAICEAVGRPNMRFVPIKSIEQQAILSVHRVRRGFVKARTAQANQIRGLLGEFGLVIPKGICHVARCVPALLEDASNELPWSFRQLIDRLSGHLKDLDQQVRELGAPDYRLAPRQRAQPQAREDPRHRAAAQPAHWSPRSPTRGASTTAGKYRPG